MNTPDQQDAAIGPETHELSTHECWKYLRSSSVGRVAVVVGEHPEIFPVNYVPDDDSLVFRTGPGTKLDAVLRGKPVAFEADGMNTYGTIAWSVMVKGTTAEVQRLDDLPVRLPEPWEEGGKEHVIRILPSQVSGRRFVIAPPGSWWNPADGNSE
ncbi:pyridoxamine 5'-phosphate oxidase family protein [Arthrobacter sp. NyZ413]|uniref:pyridoxamine 5'-phosphate oxidase family protein n=1 Tax=Arthrobacter sp. NyZ413 TaxID=3144669 RepID=UPI003BF7FD4D